MSILQQIIALCPYREKVHIGDFAKVECLVDKFVRDGIDLLQTVLDFDETLTKFAHGRKTTYGLVVWNPVVPKDIRQDLNDLYEKYHRIEVCDKMSNEEKTPHMVKWYSEKHEILCKVPLSKQVLSDIVANSEVSLREKAGETLTLLSHTGVPTLILSAGLGDIVVEVLRVYSLNLPNIKIVSNFMNFDDEGTLIGFKDHIIHLFNKSESSLHDDHSKYWEEISHRTNVIVVGDTLGDAHMAEETDTNSVLKIGFLNSDVDDRLESFMKSFDVVLTEDETFNFVFILLQHVLKR